MKSDAITIDKFRNEHARELKLELVAGAKGMNRLILEPSVNRPGLILAGFTRYFAYKRVQALGNADVYFLKSLTRLERPRCSRLPQAGADLRSPAGDRPNNPAEVKHDL
jgi:HPr kinase/phosphorylase